MKNFDIVPEHKSLFLIRHEVLTKSISGYDSGLKVPDPRNLFDKKQIDKVQEIRERKLGEAQLRSYKAI